jgi:hypothetical protein
LQNAPEITIESATIEVSAGKIELYGEFTVESNGLLKVSGYLSITKDEAHLHLGVDSLRVSSSFILQKAQMSLDFVDNKVESSITGEMNWNMVSMNASVYMSYSDNQIKDWFVYANAQKTIPLKKLIGESPFGTYETFSISAASEFFAADSKFGARLPNTISITGFHH